MKEKLQQLSWKQKNVLFVGALLLIVWIVYSFAVSLTVQLSGECSVLQEKIDSAAGAQVNVGQLEAELARFNEHSGPDAYVTHEQLLDMVSGYCGQHDLLLRDFPATLMYHRDEWNVEVHRITVQGSYAGIVQLLEFLRKSEKGKVMSADFFSKTDNKTKIKSLLATIYVQCISEQRT
jgi:hypothetical protein